MNHDFKYLDHEMLEFTSMNQGSSLHWQKALFECYLGEVV